MLLNSATSFNRSLSGLSALIAATNLLSLFPRDLYSVAQVGGCRLKALQMLGPSDVFRALGTSPQVPSEVRLFVTAQMRVSCGNGSKS